MRQKWCNSRVCYQVHLATLLEDFGAEREGHPEQAPGVLIFERFGSDAGQAPVFGAQLGKAVFGFDIEHSRQYLASSRPTPHCVGRAVRCGTAVSF